MTALPESQPRVDPTPGARVLGSIRSGTFGPVARVWSVLGDSRFERRVRWTFGLSAAIVLTYVVSVCVRPVGSSFLPVDGWGVDLFELTMGGLCIWRYVYLSKRRPGLSSAPLFPLVLGAAVCSWALGDVAVT